jgi:hypothetical protein
MSVYYMFDLGSVHGSKSGSQCYMPTLCSFLHMFSCQTDVCISSWNSCFCTDSAQLCTMVIHGTRYCWQTESSTACPLPNTSDLTLFHPSYYIGSIKP